MYSAVAKRFSIRWIVIVVGLLAVSLIAVLATRKPADEVFSKSPLVGKPAPEVLANDLNGKPIALSAYRGKVVVLNFFASWCVPCQKEQPELKAFASEHSKKADVQIVGVTFDDRVTSAKSFLTGAGWPAVDDSSGKYALTYGVRGPPESFIIDQNGYVAAKVIGQLSRSMLDSYVKKLEAAS